MPVTLAARLSTISFPFVAASAPSEARDPPSAAAAPEPTNEGYGWAKRIAEQLGRYYDSVTSLQVAICRPFNAYGPRDHWDEKTSHVIPALIKRAMDGENPVVVWGSGNQTRAFLHARDVAKAMTLVAEKATSYDPINIGHESEVSIRCLAELILEITGSKAELKFDTLKPDGYPRRAADSTFLRQVIGWVPKTPLADGIKEMVEEYEEMRAGLRKLAPSRVALAEGL